ncbi:MAG: DNA replication protein [Alphaproteobacteria bacterium]|nr:DNA replication protein [Alphaproteobacteria bacterium]MBT7942718.1 DNA replication protein [Alphaproteobacteria bacterium]
MTEPGQLTLEFEHRPAFGGEDFLVAPPNAEAVRWLDTWPDWPGTALVLNGPAGSGKTHLAQVFQAMSRACVVSAADLRESQPPNYLGDAPAAILENADAMVGETAGGLERAILHLYNVLKEGGRHLLLTAKQPPARWGIELKDLSSRLNTASLAGIGSPDDALITAVLVKQFQDRQLRIDADVISFMLARMERSFEAACHMVESIDALALKERRNITVPLVRKVLEQQTKQTNT